MAAKKKTVGVAGKKLGSGANFAKVMAQAKASGAKNPAAVAAVAGRRAHGAKAMAKFSAMGRKRAARARKK
jgi:hypothetical protein